MTASKINVQPTPDAERIVRLVQFGYDALQYLEGVNALFDGLIEDKVITERGPDGDLVADLVTRGRICFPESKEEKKQ